MNEMLRSLPRRDDEVPPTLRSPDGEIVSSTTYRRAPAVELEFRAPRRMTFARPALPDLGDSRLARWIADPPSLARRGVARLVEAAFNAIGGELLSR
jgi:hypothetical protein